MLTRLFGKINSSTTLFVGIAVLLLVGCFLFFTPVPDFQIHTPWIREGLPINVGYILVLFLFLILAFGLQWLLVLQYKLLLPNAYLPLFTTLLFLLFLHISGLQLVLLAVLFCLVLGSWLSVFQGEKLLARTLNTGLLIGVAALLQQQMVLLVLFSFIAYALFGQLNLRTFFILLVGVFSVWLNTAVLEYLIADTTQTTAYLAGLFSVPKTAVPLSLWQLVPLGLLTLPALAEFVQTVNRASVFKRQVNTVLLLVFILLLVGAFLFGTQVSLVAMLLPALLVLFVNAFQYIKKHALQELILWSTIALVFVWGIFKL